MGLDAHTVHTKNTNIRTMSANVSFVVRHPMAVDVRTVLQANTATDMEETNAFGADLLLQVVVVPTVRLGCTKSKCINGWWGGASRATTQIGGNMHIEKFKHNGEEHEVRVICDGESVYVKVFQDNRPSNRFRYSATMEVIQDMATVAGTDAVKHLIEIAKQDVINGLK